jgi:hypothetical protein
VKDSIHNTDDDNDNDRDDDHDDLMKVTKKKNLIMMTCWLSC